MTIRRLLRNITAADLAMDSLELGEGYPPDHVIGPVGSLVSVVDDSDSEWTEVCCFALDPFAQGFIPAEALGDPSPMSQEEAESQWKRESFEKITTYDTGSSVCVLVEGHKVAEFLTWASLVTKADALDAAERYADEVRKSYLDLARGER